VINVAVAAKTDVKKPIKQKRKKTVLRVIKETYGDIPIEEAFRKALEPYFDSVQVYRK